MYVSKNSNPTLEYVLICVNETLSTVTLNTQIVCTDSGNSVLVNLPENLLLRPLVLHS